MARKEWKFSNKSEFSKKTKKKENKFEKSVGRWTWNLWHSKFTQTNWACATRYKILFFATVNSLDMFFDIAAHSQAARRLASLISLSSSLLGIPIALFIICALSDGLTSLHAHKSSCCRCLMFISGGDRDIFRLLFVRFFLTINYSQWLYVRPSTQNLVNVHTINFLIFRLQHSNHLCSWRWWIWTLIRRFINVDRNVVVSWVIFKPVSWCRLITATMRDTSTRSL